MSCLPHRNSVHHRHFRLQCLQRTVWTRKGTWLWWSVQSHHRCSLQGYTQKGVQVSVQSHHRSNKWVSNHITDPTSKYPMKQECIPVGCVPPSHWPYLIVSHACPPATMHTPSCNHACSPQPCMPLTTTHAPQPCTPPQPHMPPAAMHVPTTIHAPHNHACPPQPCMPPTTMHAPHNHAHTPATTPPQWTEWLTDRCKNITFANFVCGRNNRTTLKG